MIKTSTNNLLIEQEETLDPDPIQDQLFFESIKKPLNRLMRNPSDETIEKILDFSKKSD
ncbi:hypothetical protein [Pedobacter flavus]|uniref:Uncharacterized protein n=1 Tax=Pedobacter flavus TaxID=3113906 RepID=A0ABU7H173_9SPHI|nr:hypothetical protein [Pedobacter sp. VNH31]MEE1884985.1 hypothetical protein [Pedobacter sp. VNH31]